MCGRNKCLGYITIALGAGVLLAVLLPPCVLVFLLAAVTICLGLWCVR